MLLFCPIVCLSLAVLMRLSVKARLYCMPCPALKQTDAASKLLEELGIFGLPAYVIRQLAEARRELGTHGVVTLHVVNDEEVRITTEKSIKIQHA